MKKCLCSFAVWMVLFCIFSVDVLAGDLVLKPKSKSASDSDYTKTTKLQWDLLTEDGKPAGSLETTDEGNYVFYDRNGTYEGIILSSLEWIPKTGKYIRVTPQEAQLYLDIVKALRKTGK